MRWRNIILTVAIATLAACGASPTVSESTTGTGLALSQAEPLTVFTHCGFWEIEFDDRSWTPASINRGDMPEGTDSMATQGSVRMASEDRLVFTAGSGLVVEFSPAPPGLDPIPGCD